ncbi:unnamed protein product [Prorocentrum cordatum]|uniref:Uncharacterized protein n=1 Tax=Prorocentrum cordatum TaxID=2364126 RepID=A0ABN9VQS9_9DINO|nr:unnamed protein product [Polarella glacialis]
MLSYVCESTRQQRPGNRLADQGGREGPPGEMSAEPWRRHTATYGPRCAGGRPLRDCGPPEGRVRRRARSERGAGGGAELEGGGRRRSVKEGVQILATLPFLPSQPRLLHDGVEGVSAQQMPLTPPRWETRGQPHGVYQLVGLGEGQRKRTLMGR